MATNTRAATPSFIVIVFVMVGWLLVLLFQDVILNLFYETLELDPKNTWHSLLVFAITLGALLIFLNLYGNEFGGVGPYGSSLGTDISK